MIVRKFLSKKQLIIAFTYILGILLLTAYARFTLKKMAHSEAKEATTFISTSLKNIQVYYQKNMVSTLYTMPCNVFLNSIRSFLFLDPAIRSVNLSERNTIYCSSITRMNDTEMPYNVSDFSQPENKNDYSIFYLRHSGLVKEIKGFVNRGIILIRFNPAPGKLVHIALHADSFLNELNSSPYYILKLDFTNASFLSDGRIIEGRNPLPDNKKFEISYIINNGSLYHYILSNYSFIILFWTLIVAFTSNTMYQKIRGFTLTYLLIQRGLKKNQFEPHLQPIFDKEGDLCGAEVLARWKHPKKGLISPDKFIRQAENNGQIRQITSQLITKCINELKDIQFQGNGIFHLSLNVCPNQFEDKQFLHDIDRFQEQLNHQPIVLIVELTERQEFQSNALYLSSINNLKSKNTLIALDDFGTGYCSMKYLLQTEVNVIKIDRSYVSTIDNGSTTSILDCIISLARSINVPLLAEGVETYAQYAYLKDKNIEEYQGYLFGKPVPLKEFIAMYLTH